MTYAQELAGLATGVTGHLCCRLGQAIRAIRTVRYSHQSSARNSQPHLQSDVSLELGRFLLTLNPRRQTHFSVFHTSSSGPHARGVSLSWAREYRTPAGRTPEPQRSLGRGGREAEGESRRNMVFFPKRLRCGERCDPFVMTGVQNSTSATDEFQTATVLVCANGQTPRRRESESESRGVLQRARLFPRSTLHSPHTLSTICRVLCMEVK